MPFGLVGLINEKEPLATWDPNQARIFAEPKLNQAERIT